MASVTKRLESTAYHEAGHAVAACLMRRRFQYVTIEPHEDSLGHILYQEFREKFRPDIEELTGRDVDLIERYAVCCYAGAAAAGLRTGRDFDQQGADKDRAHAIDMLSYVIAENDELGACARMLQYRARNLIRGASQLVEAVAKELLSRRKLGYRAARNVMREAAGACPPFHIALALGIQYELENGKKSIDAPSPA